MVHGRGLRLLINFSLNNEVFGADEVRLAPRVIVIAHDENWTGAIERFDGRALNVSADLGELTIGGNRMTVLPDGYRVAIDLPDKGIRGELHFTSASRPFVVRNQPVGDGRISWLFVPRLRADGMATYRRPGAPRGRRPRLSRPQLGSVLVGRRLRLDVGHHFAHRTRGPVVDGIPCRRPTGAGCAACPKRSTCGTTTSPPRYSGTRRCRRASDGLLSRAADCTLPPPMRLLLDGEVPGVPERIDITATRAGDRVHAEFRSQSYARLAQPSEVRLDRSTVLCETSGTARASGTINGEDVDFVGTGVFEFLYG